MVCGTTGGTTWRRLSLGVPQSEAQNRAARGAAGEELPEIIPQFPRPPSVSYLLLLSEVLSFTSSDSLPVDLPGCVILTLSILVEWYSV